MAPSRTSPTYSLRWVLPLAALLTCGCGAESSNGNTPQQDCDYSGPAAEWDPNCAQQCSMLQEQASTDFSEALKSLPVAQCASSNDCEDAAFYSDNDGCWASCNAVPGTLEYRSALLQVADDVCKPARDQGCVVLAAGCTLVAPPGYMCIDSRCLPIR